MNPKTNSNRDLKKAKIVSMRTYFSFFVSTLSLFISCNAPKLYNPCDVSSVSLSKTLLVTAIFGKQASLCGKSSSTNATFDKPSLLNVRENGIISSGFLIGTASSSAARVEVSIDNGQFETATGTSTWKFKLPSGSSTFKSYSKHLISVRAVSSNEVKSDLYSINVRKGTNQDVNGDGYADLAVGAPAASSNFGAAYIFHSSGSGGIAQTTAATANSTLTGSVSNGYLGNVELGDLNGDGFADLVSGAYAVSSNKGASYYFASAGTSGIVTASDSAANAAISSSNANENFGLSVR